MVNIREQLNLNNTQLYKTLSSNIKLLVDLAQKEHRLGAKVNEGNIAFISGYYAAMENLLNEVITITGQIVVGHDDVDGTTNWRG